MDPNRGQRQSGEQDAAAGKISFSVERVIKCHKVSKSVIGVPKVPPRRGAFRRVTALFLTTHDTRPETESKEKTF